MADFWTWLEHQRQLALDLGIGDRAFWQMTPRALIEAADIHQRRENREWERAAWMTHHIMAAFIGKKAPSIQELLGRVEKNPRA